MTAIVYAIEALRLIPNLVAAGVDIYGYVAYTSEKLKEMQAEDRDPSDEEWDYLNQLVLTLREQRPDVSEEE